MKNTVLVTGGSRGIGKSIIYEFLAANYDVAFTYLNTFPKFLNDIKEKNIKAYKADVSREADVKKLIHEVIKDFGKIDVLINNAGVTAEEKLITDTKLEEFKKVFDVNVKGTYLVTRESVKHMLAKRYGRIINISSILGMQGASCNYIYSGSKAALVGFTRALAKELGPFGITVNAISPGFIQTDMTACFSKEEAEVLRQSTAVRKLGTPSDISHAAIFLAGADFITGQIFEVDGGLVLS